MEENETAVSAEGEAVTAAEVENEEDGASTGSARTELEEVRTDSEEAEARVEDPQDIEHELEEIERGGRRAKIPAWLKPELMMQADYTRKTQELAEARRAFEAQRDTVQHASQAELSALANLTLIDRQLGEHARTDWNSLFEQDAAAAQKAFAQYQLLKDARTQTLGYLGSVREERTLREQQESAKRLEEGAAELARDLKDWSPQTAAKLLDFGQRHFGFSKEDLDGIDDPRLVKVLHAAFQWEEHQQKQKRAQSHAAAQTARPAARVGGASPKPGLDDRLSAEEWLRRRNEQVRKRA
jgi:hypothetical protein